MEALLRMRDFVCHTFHACLLTLPVFVGPSYGADTDGRNVADWLSAEWQADTSRGLANVAIQWRFEATSGDADRANPSIGNEDYGRLTLRFANAETWRLSEDSWKGGVRDFRVDHTRTPQLAWKMTPSWLVVLNPDPPFPDGHPLDQKPKAGFLALSLLLSGGLDMIKDGGTPPMIRSCLSNRWLASWTGQSCLSNRWLASWTGQSSTSAIIEGRWDQIARRGFIESLRFESGGESTGAWRFDDWTYEAGLQRWIARTVEHVEPPPPGVALRRDYRLIFEARME